MQKYMICTSCEDLVEPTKKTEGLFVIEIILWVCFIIPGLIYTLWRTFSSSARYLECPKCKGRSLVPLSSPKGKRILKQLIEENPGKYKAMAGLK
jgi:DNA-directed RNA polymerase subunit RPC12/RpoP